MSQKSCFVISPIGEEGSETRQKADKLLKHIIRPVAEGLGYHVERADHIASPGLITTQVIQRVIDADLVIADLSSWNPNVFYELAVRHAFGRPLVQMIRTGEKIPFDVAGMRTIDFDLQDLDNVENAKIAVKEQINSIQAGSKTDNPISVTVDLKTLRESGKAGERTLAELVKGVGEIKKIVSKIEGNTAPRSVLSSDFTAFPSGSTITLKPQVETTSMVSLCPKCHMLAIGLGQGSKCPHCGHQREPSSLLG